MAEENQIMKEPQGEAVQAQQVTKEPQRVTTKNLKKVEAGKRLAVQLKKTGVNQYYVIGAVPALGVTGGLGYYIEPRKDK